MLVVLRGVCRQENPPELKICSHKITLLARRDHTLQEQRPLREKWPQCVVKH